MNVRWNLFDDVTLHLGERVVVRGLSLEVRRGECVALCAPSGHGKSVLARCLFRSSRRPSALYARGGIADLRHEGTLLTQDAGMFDHLDCETNIAVGGGGEQPSTPDGVAARAPWSPGERRRIAFARAAAGPAPVVWLDEPFAGLDWAARDELLAQITGTGFARRAVVLVTHDLSVADQVCDRVVCIAPDGSVLELDRAHPDRVRALKKHLGRGPEATAPTVARPPAWPPRASRAPCGSRRPPSDRGAWLRAGGRTCASTVAVALPGLGFAGLLGTLVAFAVVLVLKLTVPALDPAAWVELYGHDTLVRLAPACGALAVLVSSGASVGAMVGSWSVRGELESLEVAAPRARRLLLGVVASSLMVSIVVGVAFFASGLVGGWYVASDGASPVLGGAAELGPWLPIGPAAKAVGFATISAVAVVGLSASARDARAVGRAIAVATVITASLIAAIEVGALSAERQEQSQQPFSHPVMP